MLYKIENNVSQLERASIILLLLYYASCEYMTQVRE